MVRLAPNPWPRLLSTLPWGHLSASRTVLTDTDSDISHMSNLGRAGALHLFKSQVPTAPWSWGILSSSDSLDFLPLVMKLYSPTFSQPKAPLCHPCFGPMTSPMYSQPRIPFCHQHLGSILSELKGQSFC